MTTIVPTNRPLERPLAKALAAASPLEALGRRLVRTALGRLEHGQLSLTHPDGRVERFQGAGAGPHASITALDPRFYAAVGYGGALGAAEAYIEGLWESDDLPSVIECLSTNIDAMRSLEGTLARLAEPLRRIAYALQRNTKAGSRRNVTAHYDLSNEFFQTFLDPSMTYSAGVYLGHESTLDQAQIEKIDRACRKLKLVPGDHLIEIGTGWGAMAIHAASKYGCRVTTTTISDQQHAMAEARIRAAGLQDRITLLKSDYRDLTGTYTKLVSIEMIEAVGREYLGTFLDKCSSLLDARGLALIQAITIRDRADRAAAARVDFLKKYIFPGSCLIGMSRFASTLGSRTDMDLFHVEQLGAHYARTLADWRRLFHGNLSRVRQLGYNDTFIRMWDYYLAYCEGAMWSRHCGVVQMLLSKPLGQPGEALRVIA